MKMLQRHIISNKSYIKQLINCELERGSDDEKVYNKDGTTDYKAF